MDKQQKKEKDRCSAAMLGLKVVLFLLLMLTFFGVMAINNPQIIRVSRTSGITLFGFVIMLLLFMGLMQGFDVGNEHSAYVISSGLLAVTFADLFAFGELCIMNVNEANRETIIAYGWDYWCLAVVILIQALWIVIFTRAAKYVYYRLTPPRRCCIVIGGSEEDEKIIRKLMFYRKHYLILEVLKEDDPDLKAKIYSYDRVFLYGTSHEKRNEIINYCYGICKPIQYGLELVDVIKGSGEVKIIGDTPFSLLERGYLSFEQRLMKRALDIVCSVVLIILTSPLMLYCAIGIKRCDGGKIIFKQKRITQGSNEFMIYKFRSMYEGADAHSSVGVNDDRITPFGKKMRKYRLDELPQFFNVLKGDMSMVGPRPEIIDNVLLYNSQIPEFTYRTNVKAGITGYAQIEGRYNTSPKDKMLLDMIYISKFSVLEDIKLILKTAKVFSKKDSTEAFDK